MESALMKSSTLREVGQPARSCGGLGRFRNGRRYAVARVYDRGRKAPVVVRSWLTEVQAIALAGKLRDEMTDSQVGQALAEGWNILPIRRY